MATFGKLEEFNPSAEDFSTYLERVDLFFESNDVQNQKKVPIFLNCIGSTTYSLLRGLVAPQKPADLTFAVLSDKLKAHFEPKHIVIAERFHFHKRSQNHGESVAEYLAELRKLAAKCSFGNHLEEALRDRLVCGLRSESIQKRLLSEADLTLSKAVDIAKSLEAASQSAQTLKGTVDLPVDYTTSQRNPRATTTGGKTCYRCGKTGHLAPSCSAKDAVCHECGKKGHFARVCRTRKQKPFNSPPGRANVVEADSSEDRPQSDEDDIISNLHQVSGSAPSPYRVVLHIEGKPVEMEVDTGAAVTIMPKDLWQALFPKIPLAKSSVCLRTYTSQAISVDGQADVAVQYGTFTGRLRVYVVKGKGPTLLGRDWLSHIRLNWAEIKAIVCTNVSQLVDKYKQVFKSGVGTMLHLKAHLSLRETSEPRFCKPRPVPFAIRDRVGKELDRLEEAGILYRVDHAEWAAPIVPVPKKDGTIRVCGDFKVTINPALRIDQYPLPKPSDLMASLAGGKRFTKLDLTSAYQQMTLDEESSRLVTINTHQGLYQYSRLPFGVASAPAVFQKAMDTILQGLPGVICYLDDILITGKSDREHLHNLEEVLKRLQHHGVRLRKDKCLFLQKSVEYLGHQIDETGVHTSPQKVKAVVEAPSPRNLRELRSFLGLLNYYARFLPNLALTLHPLHQLLQAGQPWCWSEACERAFRTAKEKLVEAPVLAHYDPDVPIVLAGDASAYGVGAVISHKMPDGSERPVAYASRTLSKSEQNYAQVEKEALSLVYGVRKFHQYLYGRHFTILTDHKPLKAILGPKKHIPPLAAARMQRWALLLSAYVYDIEFRPTGSHANADGLSRLPLSTGPSVVNDTDPSAFNVMQLNALPVQTSELKRATRSDPVLSKVLHCLHYGWPEDAQDSLTHFWRRRDELSVEGDCLLWGVRVVIPTKLRKKILQELHCGHPGVVRMKALARSHVWWPDIDKQIEECAKACSVCQSNKSAPSKAPLHPWQWPSSPWERIHLDFAGPVAGKMLLVVTDAHSKWPEVVVMNSTSSARTIAVLREMFARFGLPQQIVTDNGPQFTAKEFRQFTAANGVKHITTSPYHPSSNGAAERMVQTVKRAIHAGLQCGDTLEHALASFLLRYRVTPHATTGTSPSSLFLGRPLRTRLDLLKPKVACRVRDSQAQQKDYHDRRSKFREFTGGQNVWARDFRGDFRWISGVVKDRLGPLTYLVQLPNGLLWRRHVDHLRDGSQQDPSTANDELDPQEPEEDFHTEATGVSVSEAAEDPVPLSSESPVPQVPVEVTPSPTLDQPLSPRYPTRFRQPPSRLYGTLQDSSY